MSSLTQLFANHGSVLVLDAVSTQVQVGLLRSGALPTWRSVEGEAGTSLFILVNEVLRAGATKLEDVGAFSFCEGPGSMLGTRTIAMTLRIWQTLKARPLYSYQSLAIAARAEWKRRPRQFILIADARRETWHVQSISADGSLAGLQRVAAAELPVGEKLTPANFRTWNELPGGTGPCSYALASIMAELGDSDLFHPTENPDAFQHEAPDYKKWSAQTHSAETVARKS